MIPKYFIWNFRPVVEVGAGCRTLPQRFMEMGAKRVAIISDPGLVKAGMVDEMKELFAVREAAPGRRL